MEEIRKVDPDDPIDMERVNGWLETLDHNELQDVLLALSCKHCGMMPQEHAALQCLFQAGKYDALGMDGVLELHKQGAAAYMTKLKEVFK